MTNFTHDESKYDALTKKIRAIMEAKKKPVTDKQVDKGKVNTPKDTFGKNPRDFKEEELLEKMTDSERAEWVKTLGPKKDSMLRRQHPGSKSYRKPGEMSKAELRAQADAAVKKHPVTRVESEQVEESNNPDYKHKTATGGNKSSALTHINMKDGKPEGAGDHGLQAVAKALFKTRSRWRGGGNGFNHADKSTAHGAAIYKDTRREETEQLDEISKKTLGSYVKKASSDMKFNYADSSQGRVNSKRNQGLFFKSEKRRAGIHKAVDKLTKE